MADGYTFLNPKRIVLDIWLADINDCDNYEANVEGETFAGRSGFMTMSEEDDDLTPGVNGDPCALTNLAQPFSIVDIHMDTNRNTVLTWESCPRFRYCVLSADAINTNLAALSWQPRVYLWGSSNTTSWTDITTTNTTQRFYKVHRMLASPIAAGGFHSLALRPDGTLWAWGNDEDGELGDGTKGDPGTVAATFIGDRSFPVEVADPTSCVGQTINNAVALAAGGEDFSVVADADGRVWTWGASASTEEASPLLGDGGLRAVDASFDLVVASPISGVSNVVGVSAGYIHTLALRADERVFAWGDNQSGQLGIGGLSPSVTNSPVQTSVLTQIVAIAAGAYHNAALDINGRVWTWGNGGSGRLGNGGTANVTTPTLLTNIANVIAIATGDDHTMALMADKTIWTWGNNDFGQLGRSGSNTVPGLVTALTNLNVVSIAGGDEQWDRVRVGE